LLVALAACKPAGLINKTKYDGKKWINTCDEFQKEVEGLIEANQAEGKLTVSEYDNSEFNHYYLEPGQFEQIGDTLYFRLINDLEYGKYVQKGVAVIVRANAYVPEELKELMAGEQDEIGRCIVDEQYWKANREPVFLYKIPLLSDIDGRGLKLSFSIVQFNKKGGIKKEFCKTVETPLGPLTPACCAERPWASAEPHSVVELPELNISDEAYRYKGFIGTLDLIFPMNSTKFDQKKLNSVIFNFLTRYESAGFQVRSIHIDGYASQGGKEAYNQKLSEARCEAVQKDLVRHLDKLGRSTEVNITYTGRGEDWQRFEELVNSRNFTDRERDTLLAIARSSIAADDKEAQLRKLPFWKKLVDQVLVDCRHTYIQFTFRYVSDNMYVEDYDQALPIESAELYNAATTEHVITRYKRGVDPRRNLSVLNILIDERENKRPNLYAMRSTYHLNLNQIREAVTDMEQAAELDVKNEKFKWAGLALRTQIAHEFPIKERIRMYNDYNTYIVKYPNEASLKTNRLVLMDKAGYISGALAAYSKELQSKKSSAVLYNNRGVAKLKTNRLTEAQADFEEAIALNPELAEAYYNLALIAAWRGQTSRTLQYLDEAIVLNEQFKCEVYGNPVFRSMIKANPNKFKKYLCK
jgi:tetratricopeptide (TPR) repeat protein